jgi:monothiol glutaredoxin
MPSELLEEKIGGLSETLRKEIQDNIVVIYMKGTLATPRCGFSNNSANILKSYAEQYKFEIIDHDVLTEADIRDAVKLQTGWPTIPQIFINGEFIGGNDILTEMHEEGDLHELFISKVEPT